MMNVSAQLVADVLDAFYTNVRRDEDLGPIFNGIIGDRWAPHMRRINRFWCTALRIAPGYKAADFIPAHLKHADIKLDHIDRWILLFEHAVEDLVPEIHRERFMRIAHAMSENLRISLERRDRPVRAD